LLTYLDRLMKKRRKTREIHDQYGAYDFIFHGMVDTAVTHPPSCALTTAKVATDATRVFLVEKNMFTRLFLFSVPSTKRQTDGEKQSTLCIPHEWYQHSAEKADDQHFHEKGRTRGGSAQNHTHWNTSKYRSSRNTMGQR
jgi:hypothetical protein